MKREYTTADGCLALSMFPILAITNYILNGFVLVKLWEWFIVPQFEWASPLTIPYAIGLSIVVGFLTYYTSNTESSESESVGDAVIHSFAKIIARAGVALFVGYIVLQFV